MKPRFFYAILAGLLLTLPVMSGTAYSQGAITESKVLAMVNSVDRASRKGNAAAIIATLADDVKIKMTVTTPASAKEQVITLNKEQYAFHTKRGMRRRLAYELERKNTRVKINEDGTTAIVTSEAYETLTIQQGTLRSVTSEVATLSLRDGKILVTALEARTRFY